MGEAMEGQVKYHGRRTGVSRQGVVLRGGTRERMDVEMGRVTIA
jgi:hypothetical protein